MNIILFITIIVLLLLFSYQLIRYNLSKEDFKIEIDTTWIDKNNIQPNNYNQVKLSTQDINLHDKATTEYDQSKEFIPDKENYTVYKDTGLMVDIEKPILLNSIEYNNLVERLDYYRNLEANNRYGDNILAIKRNLIRRQEMELRQNYPVVRKELSLLKMDSIVSELFKRFKFNESKVSIARGTNLNINLNKPHDIQVSLKSLESYRFIKNWLLEELSKESLKSLYSIKYVNNERFKFKHDTIVNYYIDYKNNLERYEFQAIVHRDNKEHNFFIYFDIIFDNKYINYYINNIVILGIDIEQGILFADLLDKDYKLDDKKVHLSLSNKNPGYVTDKYINDYTKTVKDFVEEDTQKRQKQKKEMLTNGYCFYKTAPDKNSCISYTKEGGVGIWDTPCKYNEECPFYKKNLNYPNSRGGCINGFCEMPVNIKTLGYKEYNEAGENAAICYNCKPNSNCKGIECSQCCKDQEDNKEDYPTLNSPDYAFPNDYFARLSNTKYFRDKNIAPIKIMI